MPPDSYYEENLFMSKNSFGDYNPRILVVDDEKRIRDGCHRMLTQEGFDVALAETGEAGLEKITNEHFDIIMLDLMMPGLSGFEVLEQVKGVHPDTVVIVITGYATVEHTIEAMKKGAFDFIPKPFSPQDLRLVISKALDYISKLKDVTYEQSRMRVLVNYLGDGVMATDSEKNVALVNPAFLKMLGYVGKDVTTRPVSDFIKESKILDLIDQALTVPEDGFEEFTEELTYTRPSETEKNIIGIRCVPFKDRIGRNLGTLTVLHDITAAKKMDQLKSDFVSMVSHEIRSPLNSVLMQFKVVLDGLAGDLTEKQKSILNRSSERIKALVNMSTELLDLSKIESGLITHEKEQIDLGELLADQTAFHLPRAEAKKITLTLSDLPDLPLIMANHQNMEEVLSNLITNAINYTPEGGSVTIGATRENNYLVLTVKDTGLGIPPEDRERIFERFYRVKNEETRYITGTGLGLPIVKTIVEAHNGTIKVDSRVGEGTTFYVYLPIMV